MTFKTSMTCGGCVASATPTLNSLLGEGNWEVDLQDPQRTLKVYTDKHTDSEIVEALSKVGYTATLLSEAQ